MESVSYLVRHGHAGNNAARVCNGDPTTGIRLTAKGLAQCRRAASALWLTNVRTLVTSELPRARQTGDLLLRGHSAHRVVEPLINEETYGHFEGGSLDAYKLWCGEHGATVAPPGGGETRLAVLARFLRGLRACLAYPGPRLVVGHGLMLAMVRQLRRTGSLDPITERTPAHVTPLVLSDAELGRLVVTGLAGIARLTARQNP
ncbi:Broad specificity phosphatase PhoE [Streptoalloteichus tenebrarius]|uniref:Broad specificity phosphatase PhoE n=1 Tax=Streptoalloteichus tenebrarius (strain ATCC 17920 / DSM 40477 / JCM 4838 / CBS 697.72 / NBRC 16177 / NCIMB 11028 / NRRL B-12390 / A12253. 1 / ISP 5477) TaxID=1933 RepID=A0ABT1HLK3_STRSD|nr:histidine phosphatase family protein [Streptoalloteichus tenebrarius]MCP2256400.1 Broad specificity phosphatase PhoE [Streptoalloteichus tenebrarius]BFF04748.1 hypothetical protein GCM10020241_64230 [Streptoalloteichus tenebrarius]